MKKIVFLLFLTSIAFIAQAQKTKVPTDRFAFNVIKGSTFENITIPSRQVIPTYDNRTARVVVSKDITLKVPGTQKTFLVSSAQYELLKEIIQVTSIQVVVNPGGEMIAYSEFQ